MMLCLQDSAQHADAIDLSIILQFGLQLLNLLSRICMNVCEVRFFGVTFYCTDSDLAFKIIITGVMSRSQKLQ